MRFIKGAESKILVLIDNYLESKASEEAAQNRWMNFYFAL